MEKRITRRYETTSVAGEAVRAFVPASVALEFPPEHRQLLEEAIA